MHSNPYVKTLGRSRSTAPVWNHGWIVPGAQHIARTRDLCRVRLMGKRGTVYGTQINTRNEMEGRIGMKELTEGLVTAARWHSPG